MGRSGGSEEERRERREGRGERREERGEIFHGFLVFDGYIFLFWVLTSREIPVCMKNTLEERVISFAGEVALLSENLSKKPSGVVISNQIVRSSIAVALNYAEALSAQSRKDFIHKLSIGLKELRETHIALKLVQDMKLNHRNAKLSDLIKENDELISIFVASINTARKNLLKEQMSKSKQK
jgi:four helix bundle protein